MPVPVLRAAFGLFLALPAMAQGQPADQGSTPSPNPAPSAWFAKVFHDEGQVFEGSKVTHLFPFKNPTAEPRTVKWMIKTCGCASAWLVYQGKEVNFTDVVLNPVTVPPGGEGAVKLLITMTHRGPLEGTVTVGFDDPACPTALVKLQATGMAYFEVTPQSLSLGELSWNESKEFSFSVTSFHVKEWTLTGTGPLPPGVKLDPPERKVADGRITYSYKGILGPDLPPGPAGGTLKLQTDFKEHVIDIQLAAQVRQPYKVTPLGYLGFGLVRRAQGSPARTVAIEDLDPQHALQLLGVELGGLNRPAKWVELARRDDPAQGRFEITLRILPGAPPGEFRGRLLLALSHPRAPKQEVEFSAVIR